MRDVACVLRCAWLRGHEALPGGPRPIDREALACEGRPATSRPAAAADGPGRGIGVDQRPAFAMTTDEALATCGRSLPPL
jgi:hypothetical protein